MTREEVIKALSKCCLNDETDGCEDCEMHGESLCQFKVMQEAIQLLEQDRECEIKTEVRYKILNREDLLNAFHQYAYAQADMYMNFTGKDEEVAHTYMSEICGAAVLMNNILNPRKEESNAD